MPIMISNKKTTTRKSILLFDYSLKKSKKMFLKKLDSNLIGVRIVLSYAQFFSLSFTFALCYFFTIKFIESTVTKRHGHNRK